MSKKLTLFETKEINQELQSYASAVEALTSRISKIKRGTWFIKTNTINGTYYQLLATNKIVVVLQRNGIQTEVPILNFAKEFRIATDKEAREHEEYLVSKLKTEAVFNSIFSTHHDLKREICKILGRSEMIGAKNLDANGSDFNKLKSLGYNVFYNIVSEKPNFIPMTFEPKPIKDVSGSMSVPANSHTKGFDPTNCEFYMVTCRGNYGARFRHINYDDAVDEAQRIANREGHPCWVVGVVEKVNPK